jgi:hypothetical protein
MIMEKTMARTLMAAIAVASVLVSAKTSTAVAQSAFDPKAFWEQVEIERRSSTPGFDAKAFFDKLDAERRSSGAPLDARSFFARLEAEGRGMPAGFDAKKFFEKLDAERRSRPSYIDASIKDPTANECASGWKSGMRWDQPLFNALCKK